MFRPRQPSRLLASDLTGTLEHETDFPHNMMAQTTEGERISLVLRRRFRIGLEHGEPRFQTGGIIRLATPFLLYHNITADDLERLADDTTLVPGGRELMSWAVNNGWHTAIISTSPNLYVQRIAHRLGIPAENTFGSPLPLSTPLDDNVLNLIKATEAQLLPLYDRLGANDEEIVHTVDAYLEELDKTPLAAVVDSIPVIRREGKARAIVEIAQRLGIADLSHIVTMGDGTSDEMMLKWVHDQGGLAMAVNADELLLSQLRGLNIVAVATADLQALLHLLSAWSQGGLPEVRAVIAKSAASPELLPRFDWLATIDTTTLNNIMSIHRTIRAASRIPPAEA